MIIYQKRIYRADLRANPDVLYVFGDNVARRGYGGQAGEMRGEPNAVGVSTKWLPETHDMAYFSDDEFPRIKAIILEDTYRLRPTWSGDTKHRIIVVPADGIGTGLSQLPTRAPKVYELICNLGLGGVNA